jgi:hypothetical protein
MAVFSWVKDIGLIVDETRNFEAVRRVVEGWVAEEVKNCERTESVSWLVE